MGSGCSVPFPTHLVCPRELDHVNTSKTDRVSRAPRALLGQLCVSELPPCSPSFWCWFVLRLHGGCCSLAIFLIDSSISCLLSPSPASCAECGPHRVESETLPSGAQVQGGEEVAHQWQLRVGSTVAGSVSGPPDGRAPQCLSPSQGSVTPQKAAMGCKQRSANQTRAGFLEGVTFGQVLQDK